MLTHDKHPPQRSAFTLVELLVVIAIIAILICMLFPSTMAMRENARQAQCAQHLMQLGLSFQEYVASHQAYPSGTTADAGPIVSKPQGQHHAWTIRLLPYLDERVRHQQIDPTRSVYDPANDELRQTVPPPFLCPSSEQPPLFAATNYAGVHHDQEAAIDVEQHGMLFLNSQVTREQIPDGRGYTLLLGEKVGYEDDLGWLSGTRATLRNGGHALRTAPALDKLKGPNDSFVGGFGSYHPTVCGFLFADGRVEHLSNGIETTTLQQLTHRSDGSLFDPASIK